MKIYKFFVCWGLKKNKKYYNICFRGRRRLSAIFQNLIIQRKSMENTLKRFVAWIRIKAKIHITERKIYFKEKQIWWVNFGANVGHEAEGKNDNFERPILILKKFNEHLLWSIPLTTKNKEENPYYHKYTLKGEEYSAVLSQLRVLSSKRLLRKVGRISNEDFEKIREKIRKII